MSAIMHGAHTGAKIGHGLRTSCANANVRIFDTAHTHSADTLRSHQAVV